MELILPGDINELLGTDRGAVAVVKQLKEAFPFDVINLDYTDLLHFAGLKSEISEHIQTIDEVFRLQRERKKEKFVLLLTTRVIMNKYNQQFLDDLRRGIDENIAKTPRFCDIFQRECGCMSATQWKKKDERSYFALALAKYLLRLLREFSYNLTDWDIRWLTRDEIPPVRHLLHLALKVEDFIPKKTLRRKSIHHRTMEIEMKSIEFIRRSYPELAEKKDRLGLAKKHSEQLRALNASRFELKTPNPMNNA